MNKMMKTVLCALCLVQGAWGALAATKTVTWTLPSDWEGRIDLDQICEPVGAPSVAYYNALIEVPSTATNFVITTSDVAYRTSELGRPAPVLEPSVIGEPQNAPVEDAALYAGIYPSDVFEKGEPWEMGGKTVLPVRIKVYRWNGLENKVEALSSLKLSIACESPRATLKLTTSAVPTAKVDYIVISPHNYVSYWQKFIDYRRTTHKDMTFEVVDANDIYNTYSGHDDALKIHHFIEAMYKLGTRYILLGAGAQHTSYNNQSMIPTRICVTYNGNTQSCDYYYCVLDYKGGKEVWDYNGDQIYLASKNPNGGYYTDATSQFTWQGSMMVHRFPARDSISMGGKTKTAQQQIEGYVEKLKRAEQGLFAGRFSQAALGHQRSVSSDTAQGNTSEDCTMEREFYDHGANIFAPVHGSAITSIELDTRARVYNYMTVNRPIGYNKSVLQFYYKNGEDANAFYGRNFDAMIINAHGSPEVVEPINREGLWKATGLSLFHIMCCPCHAGNPCDGGNNVVSIGEAGVVNPDGGALVSYSNSSSGWYSSRDTMSQKIEVNLLRSLYGHLSGKGFQDAGTARLYAQNNYGTPSPRNANGQCIANGMAYGDPLVKLSPIWSRTVDSSGNWRRGDQDFVSDQEFASTLTIDATNGDQTITITNAVGAAYVNVNGTSGKTLTLAASGNGKFTVANKVTVKNGMTLNWDVPGGFGRSGIQFSAGGNLRLRAGGYYGIEFQGMNSLNVAPPANTTAIVDFDSKGYFRNEKCGQISVTGQGETVFRSRQAGIFSTSLNIPVTGGTLTLETPCVGGSGAQSSTTPLFTVSNATLAVRSNPNWTPECFSRRVAFYDGSLKSSYDKFYLGPNVSNYPGLDIFVDGNNNSFIGNNLIRLNGQLRIHSNNGGKLNVTATLANGSGTGSICLKNGVTLRLAGVNTFTGGITVESGARLIVADPSALSSGTLTVRAGGVLEVETMPLKNVRQIVIEDSAKLVVHGQGQLFNPNTTSWRAGSGMEIYSTDGTTETKVDAIITAEGAFFNPSAALTWKEGTSLNWVNNASVLAWTKNGTDAGFQDGQAVYIKDTTTGANKITIPVSGAVNPSLVAFNNLNTPIEFTAVNGGTINSDSISTIGETDFKTPVTANGRFSTGGKTTLNTLTTKSLNVPSGGAINVTGSVTAGQETITIVRFYCTETIRYGHCIAGEAEYPMEISEYRCYSDASGNTLQFFPVGSVITDSKGNSVKITGINGSAYVFGEESGDTTLKNLFDGSTSTTHPVKTGTSGPWWIQVTMPTPIPMFKVFQFGTGPGHRSSNWIYSNIYGDHPTGNPYKWQVQAGNSTDKLTTVINMTTDNESKLSWTAKYTASTLPSSSSAVVQSGGTLYLNGTYNIPLTINAGATLAVTNNSKLTFGTTKSIPTGTYAMTLDATQAQKSSTYFQVTSGGGFSSIWQVQTADDVAADIRNNNLWIATEGVMPPPYARTISGSGSTVTWNTNDWKGKNDTAFANVWGSVITKPSGSATLNVTGTNHTMNIDCAVNLDTLKVTTPTNCFPDTFTVNLASGGSAGISALDFRDFNGKVIWKPALASWGTHVYVGTNEVTIASMTSGKGNLQVGAGGKATVPEKFAAYDVDNDSYVRFTGTHNFAMSDIPGRGYLSFSNTTLSGGFQNALIKYIVENGDTLTFTGTSDNYGARMSSSFDIRGGSVIINSNAASTWFGINGETSFRQTNGTFRCTANDTTMSASNSGFLVGYSASSSDNFEFDISGGRFEIPNTYINFFGPVRFNLTSNGVAQAKGVYRGSNKGIITVNEGATFELGSIGLVAGACDFNLYGGTLAGFENGARTCSTVNLVGVGTLAAKANTTFTIDAGTINTDGATLNIGNANYTGTVKFTALPAGVTNYNVVAGTWDLGALRPTSAFLTQIDGTVKVKLSNEELVQAAQGGLAIFKTTLDQSAFTNKFKVLTPDDTELTGLCSVQDGNLVLRVGYVYPLKAVAQADTAWENLGWVDSIGMTFLGNWSDVTSAELTNTLNSVTLTVPTAFTSSLKVVNTGDIVLSTPTPTTYTLSSLDDSVSTGKTTVGFTANSVTAGMCTELGKSGTTLNVASGKYACLANGVTFTTQNVVAGAHVRYNSDTTRSSLGGYVAGAIYSYNNALFNTNIGTFNWVLRTEDDDAVTLSNQTYYMPIDVAGGTLNYGESDGECLYGGNPSTATNSVITVNGGTMKVNVTGEATTGSSNRGFIIGVTTGNQTSGFVTKYPHVIVNSGTFDCSTGLLAPWEYCNVYLNGGTLKAKGICRGGRTEANLNLNGGVLEIGALGIQKRSDSTGTFNFRLQGGTIRAVDNVTLSLAPATSGTSYLQAVNGKKLTIGAVPSGTGTLICGDTTNNGTVELTGGSYENLTLGGTFTIRLTTTQQSTTLDVALFKAAVDLDPANVTVVKNDGMTIEGVKVIKDGKLCWAPASGYMLPVVATMSGTKDWLDLDWKDSSPTPREVPDEFWTSFTTASVKLIAEGEAKINEPTSTITVATTEVTGAGRLSLPQNNLTLGTVMGDGTIVCDGFCKTYTGLNASAWTGTLVLTNNTACTGTAGYDFTNLGNADSIVEVSGIAGWFNGCSTCTASPFKGTEHHYTLRIGPGGLNLNDGSSNQGYCFDKLVGAGNLSVGKASGPSSRVIVLDATEYTGTLSAIGNSGVIIGTPSAGTDNTTISIDGTFVSQGTVKLSAANGVTVRAGGIVNLVGDETQKTWPINTSGSLICNGTVKLNGEKVLTRNWKVDGGSIVLRDELLEYPSVLDSAYLWLDATESSSITKNDSGEVQSWKSVVGDKSAAKYSATGVTAGPMVTENAYKGKPVVDFGDVGSGKDLSFTRATTIKAVFMLVDIAQVQGAFLLGDGTTYHFHRGSGGNYFSGNPPAEIKTNGKTYRNGVQVADPVNTKIPTGYGLIEVIPQDTSTQICAERICADRNCADSSVYRNGGKKVGELVILTTAPTEDERRAIENYLMGKWGFGYSATITESEAEFTTGEGINVLGGYSAGADFTVKNPTIADAVFNIGQAINVGAFTVNAAQPLTITANNGSVTATSINDSASTAKTVLDFATGTAPITAGADTVLNQSGTGAVTVNANKKVTLADGVTTGTLTLNATGTIRREGTITGSDNFGTLMSADGYYEFKDAAITGNMENKALYGRKLVVQEGDNVTLTSTGSHKATDISVYVHGGALRYTTAAVWFASDVNYVQDGGTVTFDATGDGTNNNASVIPGYTSGSKSASMAISGGLTDISKTSIRFDQTSAITVSGTGTLKVKGFNGNTANQHPVTLSEQGTLWIGGNNWITSVGSLVLNGGTFGAFENATMAAGTTVSSLSTLATTNGATLTVSGVISGAGAIDVYGAVTLSANNTFTGALTVKNGGTLTMNANNVLNGSNAAVIEQGGTINYNGKYDVDNSFTLKGGKLVNNGGEMGTGKRQMGNITLEADSEIGGSGNFGMISGGYAANNIYLNGHTLTKTGNNTFWLCNTTIGNGVFYITAGAIEIINPSSVAGTLRIGASGTLHLDNGKTMTIGTLSGANGTIINNGTIKVTNFDGSLTIPGMVELAANGTVGAGTIKLTGSVTGNHTLTLGDDSVVEVGANGTETAYTLAGSGTVRIRLSSELYDRIDDVSTGIKVAGDGLTVVMLNAQGEVLEDREATIKDGVIYSKVAAGVGVLYWIGSATDWHDTNAWTNRNGVAQAYEDGDICVFPECDSSVTINSAIAPDQIILPKTHTLTIAGHANLGTFALDVPEAAMLKFTSSEAFAGTFTGNGTVAFDPGMSANLENTIPASAFASFTGTYHLMSGRVKMASAVNSAVTLKVTDGGQFWLSGGTWNNRFELSGQGWKHDTNNGKVEYAALRIDATIADAATINFTEVDDVVPAIGKVGDYSLGCTLTGCGFVKYGTGTLTLSNVANCGTLTGTTHIAYGTLQFGNNGANTETAYALGSSISVASGATLKVKLGTSGAPSHAANQYYWLNSDVILNGGTLTSDDGGYKFKKIDVRANSEVKLGWNKRHTIDYLSGSANLTLYRNSAGYGQAQFIISDGDYSGALTVDGADSSNLTELIPHGTALAEVSSITFGNGKLVMKGDATIGNIGTCAKPISGTGVLTLKGGTVSGVISGTMGVCIAGEVTLSGNNTYTGATTIDADGVLTRNVPSGVTESFTGGLSGTGTLVITGSGTANLTGKPLADGTVRIVGGNMALGSSTQGDITLGANGKINITSEESPMTGITITSGDFFMVDGASFANISTNGVALTEPQNWSIVGGKIKYTSLSYEVISINIAGGRNGSGESPSDYLVTGDAKVGLEQVPGNIWNNVSKRWASDASDKSAIAMTSKAYNGTVEVTRNTVKVTASANNTYGWGDATTAFFKGYLDDGGDRAQIAVEGIPYTYYDVIVYCTSDSGGYMLNPVTVNGTEYTWDDTAKKTVAGSDKWGAAQASTPEYGKNALRIEGLTGTTLAIKGGANANTARGGLAAIQIVNRGSTILNKRGFMATIAANGTLSEQTWEPEKLVSGAWHSATMTADENVTDPLVLSIDKDYTLESFKVVSAAGQDLSLVMGTGIKPSIAAYDFTGAEGITWLRFLPSVSVKMGAQLGIPNGLFTGAYSVENNTFVGGTSSELVFDLGVGNTQEITGTTTDDNKLYGLTVTSGTLRFTKAGDNTTFRGRTVTADGENAVINLAVGDCTGYSNGGTKMVVKNGGTILVSSRDTCKTPIDFAGGTLLLASGCDSSGRAFDLFGNNNWNVTADSSVVVADGASAEDKKVAIREGNFTITVAENVCFDFGAAVSKNNGYGGTEGKLVKAGAGELVLKAAGDYQKGTDINAGTLTIENVSALGTGAVTLASGATLKVKSDTANISGLTLASGAQLMVKAKTDSETIIVSGASESVDLSGVVIDVDTFTDDPIPEDTVAYRILSAANINNADKAVCGAGLKGSWTFDVEGEAGTKQTLIARKTKKGFSFTIAEVEVEEVQTTVAVHDTESKNAIDIDRDWVAEKAELTEAEKQNDETVAVAINTIGDNGAKLYESYVLGLDPKDETSKPVVAPVQTADPETVTFKVANVAINKSSGANNVTYKVYSSTTQGGEKKLETKTSVKVSDSVAIALPESGVRYYQIEVNVAPKQ